MSSILYYSKYCEVCKKYLQTLSKFQSQKDIHFICIDKRIKDELNNKWYIILENEQKIVLPNNVTKVPALLLLNQGYQVLYGDQILQHLKPQETQEMRQATKNNMEPTAFSFGGGGGGFSDIISDQYSFLDQN
jgi:thiol-disulfide isomerase/thioredoxin